MRRPFIGGAIAALCMSIVACASYQTKVLSPWLGASESELVNAWGYPQSSTDVVRIDSDTKVFSYRSDLASFVTPRPTECVVSFTIHDHTVTRYKYVGGNCPKIVRGR